MCKNDYGGVRGRGVKNWQESAYVICEPPLCDIYLLCFEACGLHNRFKQVFCLLRI